MVIPLHDSRWQSEPGKPRCRRFGSADNILAVAISYTDLSALVGWIHCLA